MKNLVIFLNELSLRVDDEARPDDMLPHVLATLQAVRAAKGLRADLVLAAHAPLTSLSLGNGAHSLATILRGDDFREEWRFMSGLDQASPWDAYPGTISPGDLQQVLFQGHPGTGLLWAWQNESTIVSFAFSQGWRNSDVPAEFREMDETGNDVSCEVRIPNLSRVEHVATHAELIITYGCTLSESSLVYEGEGFALRMFFNDHNPPHFHVFSGPGSADTLARYAIETLDVLSGNLPSNLRRKLMVWASPRRSDLMLNWNRCRAGKRPILITD